MSGLSIKNVKKSFGAMDIIHGVDVEIADGEFTILSAPPAAASRHCCA
ncbi:multiple sugar transport system ATP-binding protein [Rhizobium tibeticum]|uniref:Glycerol-3-phosphate transporter ATP-binding subunit n=1 Tax=Rhizobium tibeticum TaxID=501024 RepID=A0A1H8UXZ4_9HYPH|nr:glycerol-3-phosphate transporter ATP-binding subunit [Rhizobium tibeticum]SEP08100.1 multiple sugar transport system ATP-binding protein [Rhizobium tibeticum]